MKTKTIYCMLAIAGSIALYSQMVSARGNSSLSKTFTVTNGGMLAVTVSSGDLRFTSWNKNEVTITAEGIDEDDAKDLEISQSGNTVTVDFQARWGSSNNVRFYINLPSQFNVDAKTSGGDIIVRGSLKGEVMGKTSGGNVEVENIDGPTTLKTSGGNIIVGNVNGEGDVSTSGGNIKVESVSKTFKGTTSGGDIEVGDVGGDITVATAGGNIKVGNVSGNASVKTDGGNISLKGASGKVIAKTAGGDIELDNVTGSVEAKTSGGEVTADLLPAGNESSELASSGGDVTLYIPADAKATIEATIRINGSCADRDDYEIQSDFTAAEHTTGSDKDEKYAKYILNGGGADIVLRTTCSNINVKKLTK
jgi:hypothetical protein